jgi:hypothetical protein
MTHPALAELRVQADYADNKKPNLNLLTYCFHLCPSACARVMATAGYDICGQHLLRTSQMIAMLVLWGTNRLPHENEECFSCRNGGRSFDSGYSIVL